MTSRSWGDLRCEARKLEGELEVRLAEFSKLAAAAGASGNSAAELGGAVAALEGQLATLTDVNTRLAAAATAEPLAGAAAIQQEHTLARHRDILKEFTAEFRRSRGKLQAAADRDALLGGDRSRGDGGDGMGTGGNSNSEAAALLRERGSIMNSSNALDEIISSAESSYSGLREQRSLLSVVDRKLGQLGSRFPALSGVVTAIRRRKNKDTLILGSVAAVCAVIILIYWMTK